MKAKLVFGALLVSVALCGQGFGMELAGQLVGLHRNSCACAVPGPAPCEAAKACAPEPVCCTPCRTCKRCDLFVGLKDLFACRQCGKVKCCCEKPVACCEKACAAPACCEKACPKPLVCEKACHKPTVCEKACPAPACCEKPIVCKPKRVHCPKPACCEKACPAPACCEKACHKPMVCEKACPAPACCEKPAPVCCEKPARCHKVRCHRVLGDGLIVDVLKDLFACRKCVKAECGAGCGCEVGCGGVIAPAPVAPVKPVEAAPLPKAPDPAA